MLKRISRKRHIHSCPYDVDECVSTVLQNGFSRCIPILTNIWCENITESCIDVFPIIIIESIHLLPMRHIDVEIQLEHELSRQFLLECFKLIIYSHEFILSTPLKWQVSQVPRHS